MSTPDCKARQIGLRLYTSFASLLIGVLGISSPLSLTLDTSAESLQTTVWASYALILFALLGVLDVVINDILGPEFALKFALNRRNDGYILAALTYITLLLASAKVEAFGFIQAQLVLNAAACVWVAVMDVKYRYLAHCI